MTDGIIPQWYNKYKGKILSIEETQELIVRIKQEINIEIEKHFSSIEACCIKESNILQMLIGDNQDEKLNQEFSGDIE